MLTIVIIYLWTAISLYIITGGADFGAGMIELITPKKNRKKVIEMMHKSTAPIWEANHMWLILAIVILFVGFPISYSEISSSLYIPITIMLMGIIARGTSYAFRNGDTVADELKKLDRVIYISSSIVTPFFLGVIGASIFADRTILKGNNFMDKYIFNWFAPFPLLMGLVTVFVCAYLAAIYVIGNKNYGEMRFLIKYQAFLLTLCIPISLTLANMAARSQRIDLLACFFTIPGIIALLVIIIIACLMWVIIISEQTKWLRVYAAAPVLLVQIMLFKGVFNNLSNKSSGQSLISLHVPEKTIETLAITLIVASFLILPALGYLIYKFEWQAEENDSSKQESAEKF